jgi:phosphoglycolate phosphatase-like HAD superfamily hydrolase
MQKISAILFEPVGCLAEFPPEPFNGILTRVFDAPAAFDSGSEAYWRLLEVMEEAGRELTPAEAAAVQELELVAVEDAQGYEDVAPALAELHAMGVTLLVASSLSAPAINAFLERFGLSDVFSGVWTRDNAGGIRAVPMQKALHAASVNPENVMALVDTTASLALAKELGLNAMLMINEYEQGRKLAAQAPTGGIVSLTELPDAIRFVAEGARLRR